MQRLILSLFVVLSTTWYVPEHVPALHLYKYTPELLSAIILLYVAFAGTRQSFRFVAPKYWFIFAALGLVIACGVASNLPAPGPMVAALRYYVRALPFFLLPAVYEFSEAELRQQLRWLMWIALIQLPFSLYERWVVWSQGRFSGDSVTGTLSDSGSLSIFLLGAAFVASGLLLRRQLGRARYILLLLAFFLPTTINETKVTVLYLPLGMLAVFVLGAAPGQRLRVTAWTALAITILGGIFIPVYTYFEARNPYAKLNTVTEIFTDQKKLENYLSSNAKGVGVKKAVRRGDAIRVPIEYLAKDPVHLTLGLGLGSVSPSSLGKTFEGSYVRLFQPFLITSFSYFLLEIGALGMALILLLNGSVLFDALAVSRSGDTLIGGLATGWIAVTIILCISLVYATVHMVEALSYLFWYFSGVIAAERMRATSR